MNDQVLNSCFDGGGSSFGGGSMDNLVIIPMTTFHQLFGTRRSVDRAREKARGSFAEA